jgi:endogenous inhibitor of DNA gyrase (YacG/DUF329 family)
MDKIKTCPICSKNFLANKHPERTCCSKKCAGFKKRKVFEKKCPTCGKVFRKSSQHCSAKCAKSTFGWAKGIIKTAFFIKCPVCDKEFKTVPSANPRKTCSHKCKSIWTKKKQVESACLQCGKTFLHSPYKKRKHCSRECGANYRYRNHQYKTRPSETINRKEFKKCEKCGYNKIPDILERHHKDMNHENNIRTNLQILCPNCHDEIHWKTKTGKFRWKSFHKSP